MGGFKYWYKVVPKRIRRLIDLGCAGEHWAWFFVGKYFMSIGQEWEAFEYAFKRGSREGDHNCRLIMAAHGYLEYRVYHDPPLARAIFADVIAEKRPFHRSCRPEFEKLCKAFPDVNGVNGVNGVKFYPPTPNKFK